MTQLILWAASNKFQRELRIETWRRYEALQSLLHSQLQRIGELDAILAAVAALEGALFIWFLDETLTTCSSYSSVVICSLAVPLFALVMIALMLRAKESPSAESFCKGLDENENVTLLAAIDSIVKDFTWNLGIVEVKEAMLSFSMAIFFGLSIAYILGGVLE